MASVLLALREVRRSVVRFGLLTFAVGVLVFLIVFQQALISGLITQFVGAIENQSAQVLVYGEQARKNLQGSVVTPDEVAAVAAVDGVAEAAPFGVGTFTVEAAQEADATIFGYELGGPGAPATIVDGRLPETDGEAVASALTGGEEGFEIGDVVTVLPGDVQLEVVGIADDLNLSVSPTLFVSYPTWEQARLSVNPDATAVLPSAVAVTVDDGADPAAVAARITAEVPGTEALDRQTAADESPGVASVTQSFGIILLLTFVVVGLVTGFFFLILTVQKRPSLTLLRALGAPSGKLVGALLVQVLVVVGGGLVIGSALAALLLAASDGAGLGAAVDPAAVAVVVVLVLALSAISSVASIRRVLRIQPVEATTHAGGIQ